MNSASFLESCIHVRFGRIPETHTDVMFASYMGLSSCVCLKNQVDVIVLKSSSPHEQNLRS